MRLLLDGEARRGARAHRLRDAALAAMALGVVAPAGARSAEEPPVASALLREEPGVRLYYPAGQRLPDGWRVPVVVYLHGWSGRAPGAASLLESLARRGVLAVDAGPASPPREGLDFTSRTASERTREMGAREAQARAQAALALIDRVLAEAPALLPPAVATAIVRQAVGVVGFSFGGAAAAEASRLDPRVKAVLNLDGWLFGRAGTEGFPAPYMLITNSLQRPSAAELGSADEARRSTALQNDRDIDLQLRRLATRGGYAVVVEGADHASFGGTDPSRRAWYRLGAGAPETASAIVERYAAAFFGRHLLGTPQTLLAASGAPAPGLRVTVWNPPSARKAACADRDAEGRALQAAPTRGQPCEAEP